MTIKILVADDHEIVRAGLKRIFANTDIRIVAEASSGKAALAMARKHAVDAVLLDVDMPDMDGPTTLGRLKGDHPDLPVLMFSDHDNSKIVARSVALGAAGYLPKRIDSERLIMAVRTVARHESI